MPGADQFTVVVRCSDPRIDEFFTAPESRVLLGLRGERIPLQETYISNVGGLLAFVGVGVPRLEHDVELLTRLFSTGEARVVLTAHSSCGGYYDAVEVDDVSDTRVRQEDDMRSTAHRLRSAMGVDVDCYFLDLENGRVESIAS